MRRETEAMVICKNWDMTEISVLMNKIILSIVGVVIGLILTAYFYFSGREYVIVISEAVIQEKLNEKLPLSKTYLIVFNVTLDNPRVDLSEGTDRINAGLDILLNITINNHEKPLGGTLDASGALKYVPEEGAFYLAEPVVENLSIQGLPDQYTARATKAAEMALSNFYSTRPIYTLKATDIKQVVAKLLVKSLEIQEEKIVVVLGI